MKLPFLGTTSNCWRNNGRKESMNLVSCAFFFVFFVVVPGKCGSSFMPFHMDLITLW